MRLWTLAKIFLWCALLCACAPAPTPTRVTNASTTAAPLPTRAPTPTANAQNARVRLDPEIYTYWISGPEILELASALRATDLQTNAQTLLFQAPEASQYMRIKNIFSGAWSPDGARVLLTFANYADAGGSLRLVSADGKSSETFLGDGKATYEYALWSPDGKQLVARTVRAPSCIVLVEMDGTVTRELWCAPNEYPRFWSTDGKWIAVGHYAANPSAEDWTAVSVADGQRVPLKNLAVQWYDERYFPWRKLDAFTCSVPSDPRAAKAFSFWRCE